MNKKLSERLEILCSHIRDMLHQIECVESYPQFGGFTPEEKDEMRKRADAIDERSLGSARCLVVNGNYSAFLEEMIGLYAAAEEHAALGKEAEAQPYLEAAERIKTRLSKGFVHEHDRKILLEYAARRAYAVSLSRKLMR
ncbi:MAG: hypothetical protein V1743_03875 [Nanoarchaeota archaeon]